MELQISRYYETKWDKESWKDNNSHIPSNEQFRCELRCRWHDCRYWYQVASQYPVLSGLWMKPVGPSFMINFGSCKWNRNQTIHLSCGMREELMLFLHPYTWKVVCSSQRPNAVVGQSSEHCYQKWTSPKFDVGFRTPRCLVLQRWWRPVTALWGDRKPSSLNITSLIIQIQISFGHLSTLWRSPY